MPFFFADVIGGACVKADDDFVFAFTGMDAEAVAQPFLQREFLRPLKSLPRRLYGFDARGREGADVLARVVVGEEIPFAVDVRQMIRVNNARFGLGLAGLAICEFNLFTARGGFGQRVKDFKVKNLLGARAEGNGLLNVSEIERNGVGQRLFHFLDGAQQRFLEARAAILLQGFFRDDEREDFAFGDLHGRKTADFAVVKIAVVGRREFNRQVEPVAHELDVAMDGLGADFKLASES